MKIIKKGYSGGHNHEALTWNDAKTAAYWRPVRNRSKSYVQNRGKFV